MEGLGTGSVNGRIMGAIREFRFLFQKPSFPMLGSIEGYFIGAKSPKDLSGKLAEIPINKDGYYSLVDCTGKVWILIVDQRILSPLTFKKRQTKLGIIRLFNERKNTEVGYGNQYSEKSLSSKRFERIFSDLMTLSSGIAQKNPSLDPKLAACGNPVVNIVEASK